MKILVLGGYGLIGSAIVRQLALDGHEIVGLGRNPEIGRRRIPSVRWVGVDLAALSSAAAWTRYLKGIDIVVNAAGALQNGMRDDLEALHHTCVAACVEACTTFGISKFIQISAVGATTDASTPFLTTKAAGDAAVRASNLDWIILKPGLVISREAYGGTALVRMIASMPGLIPIVRPNSSIMTIHVDDIVLSVSAAVAGNVPMQQDYDLVADQNLKLRDVIVLFRRWLGFPHATPVWHIPTFLGMFVAKIADIAGWFGWRSSLRTTTLGVLKDGISGDPSHWCRMHGEGVAAPKNLEQTLSTIPATSVDRAFARTQLLIPLSVVVLAVFWIASGVIGLFSLEQSAGYISAPGGIVLAKILIICAAIIDILIGFLFFIRPMVKKAAGAAIVVSFAYLFAGAVYAPSLWFDPLGPFIKIFPAMVPAMVLLFLMDER